MTTTAIVLAIAAIVAIVALGVCHRRAEANAERQRRAAERLHTLTTRYASTAPAGRYAGSASMGATYYASTYYAPTAR